MKRNHKHGFTVVELVVVIAVVAVLAAVLIPTFSGLIENAKMSADTQLAKNVNTALAAAGVADGKNACMHDVIADIAEAGYDLAKLSPESDSHLTAWDQEADRIVYLEYDYVDTENEHPRDGLWLIATTPDEVKAFAEAGFNVYLADDVTVPEGTTFQRGVDVGNNKQDIHFETEESVDVIIRTNGGTLTIDAPNATVKHYGSADQVDITNTQTTYHESGKVTDKSDEKTENEEDVTGEETVTDEDQTANNKMVTVNTADDLIAAVADPEVTRIVLNTDIELSDPLNITTDVTLDGNRHQLSTSDNSAAARTINIGYSSATEETFDNISVTLCNINVVGPTTADAGRGVNIGGKNNSVNILNSTISCGHYAICVIQSNTEGLKLTVDKSTVTGLSALTIWSSGHVIEITDSTLTGNNMQYNSVGLNDCGTISFGMDSSGRANVFASNSVKVVNCKVNVQSNKNNRQWLVAFQSGSTNCKADFIDCTITYNKKQYCTPLHDDGSDNVLTIDGKQIETQE